MKPRIELWTKKSWLDTYISDEFCAGVFIGFCIVAAAALVIMAVYKLIN